MTEIMQVIEATNLYSVPSVASYDQIFVLDTDFILLASPIKVCRYDFTKGRFKPILENSNTSISPHVIPIYVNSTSAYYLNTATSDIVRITNKGKAKSVFHFESGKYLGAGVDANGSGVVIFGSGDYSPHSKDTVVFINEDGIRVDEVYSDFQELSRSGDRSINIDGKFITTRFVIDYKAFISSDFGSPCGTLKFQPANDASIYFYKQDQN